MLLLGKRTRTPSLTGQHKNNDLKEVFWRKTVLATDQYFHPVVSASSLLTFHLTRASTPKQAIMLFWNRSLMEYINILMFTRKNRTSYANSLYKHVQTWKSHMPYSLKGIYKVFMQQNTASRHLKAPSEWNYTFFYICIILNHLLSTTVNNKSENRINVRMYDSTVKQQEGVT